MSGRTDANGRAIPVPEDDAAEGDRLDGLIARLVRGLEQLTRVRAEAGVGPAPADSTARSAPWREPMINRRNFHQAVSEYTGKPELYSSWKFKLLGFMHPQQLAQHGHTHN